MIKSRTSKKSTSSLTIPINELIIRTNFNTKPTKYNVPMVVEKRKAIYFMDTNHSIEYKKIHHDFLMHQIDSLLDECHAIVQKQQQQDDDAKYDTIDNNVEYEEMILKIKSKKSEDKIFTCLFLVSTNPYYNTSSRSSHMNNLIPLDTFVKFLESFQNYNDKYTSKHEQKMKLKSFGRVNTSSSKTDSTSFQMTQKKNNSRTSKSNHATYGRKRQMKLQRQLDQMLKDNYSDDEEDGNDRFMKEEHDPISLDNNVCVLENEEDEGDIDCVDKDVQLDSSKKRRKNVTSGRRLIKKSRTTLIQDEDSDDDLDFEKDVTTLTEKNRHEKMKSTDIEITQTNETVEKTPAIVSPAHQNNNSNNNDKRKRRQDHSDDFSDAITEASDDEEKAHNQSIQKDVEKDEHMKSEQSNSIKNFFAPKTAKSKVDVITNTGTKKKDINVNKSLTKSKYFSSKKEQISSADKALARRPPLTPKSSSPIKHTQSTPKNSSSSNADRALAKSPLQITKALSPKALDKTNLPQAKTKNLSSPIKSPKKTPQKATSATKAVANPYKSNDLPERSIHIGLKNLGNTCYLNSSLQMIFSVPDFIASLKEIYNHYSQDQNDEDVMPLTRAVLKVAWDANIGTPQQGMVKSSGLRSVDPRDVKEAIDVLTDKFAGYEQRDAHEFASTLIDYIHDELVKVTKDRNHVGTLPTDAFFKLDVKVCLTCDSCKYTRYVEMKQIDMLQS